ncbi:hypothetical protein pb186bvf_005467 [Paramecium bursaria]
MGFCFLNLLSTLNSISQKVEINDNQLIYEFNYDTIFCQNAQNLFIIKIYNLSNLKNQIAVTHQKNKNLALNLHQDKQQVYDKPTFHDIDQVAKNNLRIIISISSLIVLLPNDCQFQIHQ